MTEKTEYIAASIDLLEQEDELNSTELAVLCNLKKFMHQTDHQPAFAVGEYYADSHCVYKVLPNDKLKVFVVSDKAFLKGYTVSVLSDFDAQPATAEQIATFKRAEHFASKGRKLDEFHVGDVVKDSTGDLYVVFDTSNVFLYDIHGEVIGEKENVTLLLSSKTAEELQEVGE